VLQDILNNIRILYRCNDSDGSTTLLDFDGEYTLVPLSPSHRVGLWFRVLLLFDRMLRNNVLTKLAVWREYSMKPMSGLTGMNIIGFFVLNLIGTLMWVASVVLVGFFL